jgi:hypothetical protein
VHGEAPPEDEEEDDDDDELDVLPEDDDVLPDELEVDVPPDEVDVEVPPDDVELVEVPVAGGFGAWMEVVSSGAGSVGLGSEVGSPVVVPAAHAARTIAGTRTAARRRRDRSSTWVAISTVRSGRTHVAAASQSPRAETDTVMK